MAKDKLFTLISYKPSSSRWEGCHCHGSEEHFSSELRCDAGLSESELEDEIYKKLTRKFDCGEDGFQFGILYDNRPIFYEGNDMSEFGYTDDEDGFVNELCSRIYERAAARAKQTKEAEAAEEQARAERDAAAAAERQRKEREEVERRQYEALKAKFEAK